MGIFTHALWNWSKIDCISSYAEFQSPSVIDQYEKYIDSNKSRNVKKPFRLHTDGTINANLCERFPHVILAHAWIAQKYEQANPNTTFVSTQILVVLWEIWSDMRFVYFVLWQTSFKWNKFEKRPKLIQEMLDRGYRALYICQHLCSILVTYYIFCDKIY